MRRLLAAVALVALVPAVALAKCAPSARGNASANGKWKIEPTVEGTFKLLALDEKKKDWVEKTSGKFDVFGHHLVGYVTDDGAHWVLHDEYAGFAIYEAGGKLVRKLAPSDLLTKEELEKTPHQWPCHTEGEWSDKSVELSSDSKTVTFGLYTKKKVELELATGESWIVPGQCTTPDNVKAHGGMNCLAQKWTCARCKKEQDGLVWRICGACCKELGVCIVCNKKVK